jgi:hypothetical protein
MATQKIQLPAWRKRFMERRGNVSAYRRVGVSACGRIGVWAYRRMRLNDAEAEAAETPSPYRDCFPTPLCQPTVLRGT